jgi:mRNA interferase HigB
VHIISERTLQFVQAHANAKRPLEIWARIVKAAKWQTPSDVKRLLGASDFLPGGIVVFDIGGNNFRISANIKYVNARSRVGRVHIRHVMTHAEYDRRSKEGRL